MDGCWDAGEEERWGEAINSVKGELVELNTRADWKSSRTVQGVKVPRNVGERQVIVAGVHLTVSIFLRQMWLWQMLASPSWAGWRFLSRDLSQRPLCFLVDMNNECIRPPVFLISVA